MPIASHRTTVLGIGLAGIIAMVILGIVVRDRPSPLDAWALHNAQVEPGSPLSGPAETLSAVGVLLAAAVLIAVSLAAWRNSAARHHLWRYPVLLSAGTGVAALQQLFQRSGPPVVAQDWTYPSGHATLATAIAITTIVLSRRTAPVWTRVVVTVEVLAVASTMTGRVALGEHYATDVLGAIVGVLGVGLVAATVLGLLPTRDLPQVPQ